MIDLTAISYAVSRDHAAKAPTFRCVASFPVDVPEGAVAQAITVECAGETKDAARDAAQLALLRKLVAPAGKPAIAAPSVPKPKE